MLDGVMRSIAMHRAKDTDGDQAIADGEARQWLRISISTNSRSIPTLPPLRAFAPPS